MTPTLTLPLHTALTLALDNAASLDMRLVDEALDLSEVDPNTFEGAGEWTSHSRRVQLCADMIRAAVGGRAPNDAEVSAIRDAMEAEIEGSDLEFR